MRLFIFGAGASYGAQEGVVERPHQKPPLTNQLFEKHYTNVSASPVGIEERKLAEFSKGIEEAGGDLETWLTDKWEQVQQISSPYYKERYLNDIGRFTFYLWHVLKTTSANYNPSKTRYVDLLTKLENIEEDYRLISFNYDTLLDRAVQDISGITLNKFEKYLKANYIKLHGSVNWFVGKRGDDENVRENYSISHATERIRVYAENYYKRSEALNWSTMQIYEPKAPILNDDDAVTNKMSRHAIYYPLMFIPVTVKMYNLVSDFEKNLLKPAEEMIQKAHDIFVIGYRARDDIARYLLRFTAPTARVRVISTSMLEARSIADSIRPFAINCKDIDGMQWKFEELVELYGTNEFEEAIGHHTERIRAKA